MKKLLHLTALLFLISISAFSQIDNPVTWKTETTHIENDMYQINLIATIERGWHLYDLGPYSDGPSATAIKFTLPDNAKLLGKIEMNPAPIHKLDKSFNIEVGYFEQKVEFLQKVKISGKDAKIKINVEWMCCNDGSCIPPTDKDFIVEIISSTTAVSDESTTSSDTLSAQATEETVNAEKNTDNNALQVQTNPERNKSIWAFIIEAILWGLAAIVTPCVFPMIPMTVSFFIKGSENKTRGRFNAIMYGVFIVALYTLPIAGIIIATRLVGGDAVTADIFNWLATHWIPNVIFFLVFMLFAASFFGAFEITLPSWMVSKSDKNADKKGLGGIFFMALTLVLVSFSCTGPIVSSVIIKATAGEFWMPIIVILVFSTVFALPFVLSALFPSLLGKLPKSGGWLNSVKVVLGFIEVALGFKFLSTADQVYLWGILDREVYLAIWIVVFTLLGFYFLGKIKFVNDSDVNYIGVGRLTLAIITFTFVVYMIPGLFGAPLKAISGYLPPMETQDFVLGKNTTGTTQNLNSTSTVKYGDILHMPHGLTGFFDLKEAEDYANKVNKPLFIDFTGKACTNCREMEERVWSDPRVLEIMKNEYVIVALYTDIKKELPESEWIKTADGKELKSLGKINAAIAIEKYKMAALPYYVIQGKNGKILVPPRGYDLDIEKFVEFLKSGVEAYKQQ